MDNYLRELMRRVYKEKGVNIYAHINRFKKAQVERKALYEIPDSVYIDVCKQIILCQTRINNHWAYFVIVLKAESEKYFSSKQVQEGKEHKKEPANIMKIMKEMMK